ncbi:hypothetical protein F8M41_020282 [Gigaspora margarita]|uniref:Uncharacterized protein n=1 Tax=Gigaspora margarita TaxID=4874 RepID=A0A8H4AIK0_GIGMA|nr:hypothetical protein F8M41_020282 [Gigaspora margarita]
MARQVKQKEFFLKHADPRPYIFFVKFKCRNSSTAHHEYELRLNEALKEELESEKLLTLHSKLKNGEFRDEWQRFKERNTNQQTDSDADSDDDSDDDSDADSDADEEDKETYNNNKATTDNFNGGMSSLTPLAEIDIREKERKNDEFESDVYETIRNGKTWIIHGTDVCDELEKWKQGKSRSCTDLAFYDIVDITPGSNSDFIRSLQNDVVEEMKQSKQFTKPKMDNADGMKDVIIKFTEAKDFRRFVNECFSSMQVNERTKFIWDYIYMLTESFERDNDLSDDNLSEFGYREIFFSPLIRYLFRGTHKTIKIDFGEKSLFASSEDRNREKTDGEDRNFGRKIDIIWSMKSSDLEFAVGEISGPPNKINHAHFFNDKIKIAKMLKVIINRIVNKFGGTSINLKLIKLYGLQVYYNEMFVYEMSLPFSGLYVFCEVLRSKLPANEREVCLLLRSVPAFLEFKELLERSLLDLRSYIHDACTRTPPDKEDECITNTDLTPQKNKRK